MLTLRIAEIYRSLQGEGEYTGTPSVFVRTSGCNLRCWFCDTPFTSWNPEGPQRSVEDIIHTVEYLHCPHVVVTGGEPLLQPAIVELTEQLRDRGFFITIETAGTVYRPVAANLMSISPKRANSTPTDPRAADWAARHEELRHQPDVIRQLVAAYPYQLKFVIDQPEDLPDVSAWLAVFPEVERRRVWLMPQATTREQLAEKSGWMAEAARERGFQFTSRWHVAQFGNQRGR